ncbi:uncharacterized protein LOC126377866 isoform X4 [Pectinophora gossypiella]|uniref:uncharacterized protein LOC126377866 isoform X4 n=1 Tax=Pectinophora gossypiella TaxID=13191 RepID=UPI00214ED8F5|nr:uncharacterized protein LOC126377866 isoform X4 [Pectinophora gossypiella]
MEPQTSRKDYLNHQYSGPRKNRKRSQAQMKRYHGEIKSRSDVWCKKKKLNDDKDVPSNKSVANNTVKTYSGSKKKYLVEANFTETQQQRTEKEPRSKSLEIFCEQPASCSRANIVDESTQDQRGGNAEKCDSCRGALGGIRLVCMQCSYSHCAACEFGGRHQHHYMLRVPPNGQKEVVQKMVKKIQMELAYVISYQKPDADPTEEQEIIKTEVKTEPGPDPLAEDASTEQLRPNMLEQTMVYIDIKEEFNSDEGNDPAPPTQETSAHAANNLSIPVTYVPAPPGASVASKRRTSSSTQPSAPKKTCIAAPGSGSGVTVKIEPLATDETLQTHSAAGGSGEPGAINYKAKPSSERGLAGRNNKGRAPKKKQKQ